MNDCTGCKARSRNMKRRFRSWMKIAGSTGTRHMFTRLQRKLDHEYQELRNDIALAKLRNAEVNRQFNQKIADLETKVINLENGYRR